MTDALWHRGPDGSGLYNDDIAVLGHRRLSIIDIEGGSQPMSNDDGSIVIVFNGEIYNYKELRQDLEKRGFRFRTTSDTEVLIRLYEDMGTKCVHELNGMFAFAIWDKRSKTMFAARDRMGEKPLYYCVNEGCGITFASEINALKAGMSVAPSMSPASMREYLTYGYVPAPNTIYKEISKLPPAHMLIWSGGRTKISRYWSPYGHTKSRKLSEHDAVEGLEELLSESIRIRLRSDVPIGAFLSGGLDSSLVVSIAQQLMSKKLNTYTVAFSNAKFDESKFANEIASLHGVNHNVLTVEDLSLDVLPDLVRQFGEPFADPSSLATYFLTREAAKHVKVCLSGDGADELFGGYGRYFMGKVERSLRRIPINLRQPLFAFASALYPKSYPGTGLLNRTALDGWEYYQALNGIFSPSEQQDLLRTDDAAHKSERPSIFAKYFATDTRVGIQEQMNADQETYLPEDILVKVDRTSMAHSLEVRVPFLDHRIVEFANGLDLSRKIHGNSGKRILKKIAAERMPKHLLHRAKHGFGIPIGDWFRRQSLPWVREILLSPNSKVTDFLRSAEMENLIETHERGYRDRSHQIWSLLWLELWLRADAS